MCDETLTWYSNLQAMPDWQQQVVRKRKLSDDPPEIEYDGVHPKNTDKVVVVIDEEGRAFVPHSHLTEAGYLNLCDFDVVRIKERFFELLSFLRKAGMWWIEEIDPEKTRIPKAPPKSWDAKKKKA